MPLEPHGSARNADPLWDFQKLPSEARARRAGGTDVTTAPGAEHPATSLQPQRQAPRGDLDRHEGLQLGMESMPQRNQLCALADRAEQDHAVTAKHHIRRAMKQADLAIVL